MATRSRTQLYVKMRSSLKTHRNADKPRERLHIHQEGRIDRGLMNASDGASDGDSAVDARIYTVPPTWVTLVDEINRAVSKIKIGLGELQTLSGKALLPGFGDDEDDNEEQITATVTEVHGLFKEAQGHLKAISNATDTSNNGDDEVRLNIQQRVAKQLQDLQLDFNKSHRAYIAKLKGQTIEEYRPKVEFNNPAASSSTTFFEDEPEVVDPRFQRGEMLKLIEMETMTKERTDQINQVAESVTELAEIFKEIQVLVIDQGTVLDRIDFNIEQAAHKIGQSETELRKANEYQKKSKTMLCIYLLLILCGAMVVVLILKKSMS